MSYETYFQALCENGHYNQLQGRTRAPDSDSSPECNICKSKIVWTNIVDDTNGDHWGIIPPDLFKAFLKSSSKVETCNLGHQHLIFHEVYNLPTEEERLALRSYKDSFSWTFIFPKHMPKSYRTRTRLINLQKQLKERAARAPK